MSTGTVLLAGGTSTAGVAVADELLRRGESVVIASRAATALDDAVAVGARRADGDLTDPESVAALRMQLVDDGVRIDRIVHLVGGWSGGRGIAGQTDEKYRALAVSFDALRVVSRAFDGDLAAADRPRLIAVSSPLAQQPTPDSANYASVKAATEAWVLALDASLRHTRDEGAASIIVTDSLAGREVTFATLVADVLAAPASRVGGSRVLLV